VPDFVVNEETTASGSREPAREKDLRRHFKSEDTSAEARPQLVNNLPPNLKEWSATSKLSDYQLKVALNYLQTIASGRSPNLQRQVRAQ
jgi:carboxyl-terminal processing protease